MKILYAIQGTGNGHLARAEDVVPALKQHGDVDLFVSGAQADIKLPFPIQYKSKGLSFYFGKKGGVDLYKTLKKNSSKRCVQRNKKFSGRKVRFSGERFRTYYSVGLQKKRNSVRGFKPPGCASVSLRS